MASTLSLWAVFALLSIISPLASSQTLQPYDCIDPQNPGLTSRVEIGQNTTVCLYTGPDGDWNSNIQYKRFSVNLVADEFSNYKVPGCEYYLSAAFCSAQVMCIILIFYNCIAHSICYYYFNINSLQCNCW